MTAPSQRSGRVTIGIPTRNRSAFVLRAVTSALAQTYPNLEVLVSDNCSTDDTVSRIGEIADPRIILLQQAKNLGMVGNFNACLTAATGEFFLLLSDDDVLEPAAIERLSEPLRTPTHGIPPAQIGLAWSPCYVMNAAGRRLWTSQGGPETESSLALVFGQFSGDRGPRLCSIMLRTDDARALGGYNEERYGALCDMGIWTRVALRYPHVACINQPLAGYTMHPMSETSRAPFAQWRNHAENLNQDLAEMLRVQGDEEAQRRFCVAARNQVTNQIVTLLMQALTRPRQLPRVLREVADSRRYLFTPLVAQRLLRDGGKLLRWWRRARDER